MALIELPWTQPWTALNFDGKSKGWCSGGDNVFSVQSCKDWVTSNRNSPDVYDAVGSYCRKNFRDPRCTEFYVDPSARTDVQKNAAVSLIRSICRSSDDIANNAFCRSAVVTTHGGIDDIAKDYCNKYNDPEFCSCKYVPYGDDQIDRLLSLTECYGTCKSKGYKTAGQRATVCPARMDICVNSIDIVNSSDVDATQNCMSGGTDTISNFISMPADPPAARIYGLVLLLVLLILGGVVMGYRSSRSMPDPSYMRDRSDHRAG